MNTNEKVPCPYCGEMIPKNAQSCSFCGSDEQTGWSDQTYLDGIDIDTEKENTYHDLVTREFSNKNNFHPLWKSWRVITGFLLIVLFILFVIRTLL